jgi:hypothetical protein
MRSKGKPPDACEGFFATAETQILFGKMVIRLRDFKTRFFENTGFLIS